MYIAATGCTGAPAELAVASSVLLPHLLDKPILLSSPQWSSGLPAASVSPPASAWLDPPDSIPKHCATFPGLSRNSA
jgi:hypothetical protein